MERNLERKTGLARALSKLGFCSRSRAAGIIDAGRVRLNGSLTRNPEAPVRLGRDKITVDGEGISAKKRIYLMMNKTRGLVTTASDEKGRETVYSVLQKAGEDLLWVAPVGRLDKASEGLLLLTNDSQWSARVAAPESHLDKTYLVRIASIADEKILHALVCGIRTKDDEILRAKQARLIRSGQKNCWLEIVLDEGKNRQIRRMLEALGIEVLRLLRVSIGPLELGNLPKGEYRHLTEEEKLRMDRALGMGNQR